MKTIHERELLAVIIAYEYKLYYHEILSRIKHKSFQKQTLAVDSLIERMFIRLAEDENGIVKNDNPSIGTNVELWVKPETETVILTRMVFRPNGYDYNMQFEDVSLQYRDIVRKYREKCYGVR